ncbi:MAG: Hint domain-containing protein [Maritimibacter sp.]
MAPTNLIINGDFSGQSSGWTGSDLETNYRETDYLWNGSNNAVAEMDGHGGQTTVMEQSFTVTDPMATTVSVDSALRVQSLFDGNAGNEGFTIDVLDSNGNVIAHTTVTPTGTAWNTYELPVTFPSAGTYTLRFTEQGVDDSLGAIIDNVSILTCYLEGTLIATPNGPRRIESLQPGDLIDTSEGPRPLRWKGMTPVNHAEMLSNPKRRPIRIQAGALGGGMPKQDLLVSRQHRMLAANPVARRMTGADEVLIAAVALTSLPGIDICLPEEDITYYHLLFDRHAIVIANGAPSESLLLGPYSRNMLGAEALDDIARTIPGALAPGAPTTCPARPVPPMKVQKSLARRLAKNGKPLLSAEALTAPLSAVA